MGLSPEIVNVLSYTEKGIQVLGGINVGNQLTLKKDIIWDYPGGPNVITKVHKEEEEPGDYYTK